MHRGVRWDLGKYQRLHCMSGVKYGVEGFGMLGLETRFAISDEFYASFQICATCWNTRFNVPTRVVHYGDLFSQQDLNVGKVSRYGSRRFPLHSPQSSTYMILIVNHLTR